MVSLILECLVFSSVKSRLSVADEKWTLASLSNQKCLFLITSEPRWADLFTPRNQELPLYPVFAPMINWVMVHVAASPPLPPGPDGGCSTRTDRPAVTGSWETGPGVPPAPYNCPSFHMSCHSANATRREGQPRLSVFITLVWCCLHLKRSGCFPPVKSWLASRWISLHGKPLKKCYCTGRYVLHLTVGFL